MISEINLQNFIKTHVTGRKDSLLQADLKKYDNELKQRINGKNVLVIGGAGSIGSAYIKAILKFRIAKLVVVDIDENGLTELVRDLRSSVEYQIPEVFITYPVNFGDSVFKRITPIASILAWAEICENIRGQICLISEKKELRASESKTETPETDILETKMPETKMPETEIYFTPSVEESKEKAEINALYLQLTNRDTELKSLEIKLEESLQRIKELEEQFADRDSEIIRLREELEAGTGKIDALKNSLSGSEENIKNLDSNGAGN